MKALLQLGVCEKFTSRPLNKSKITDIHDHPYYSGSKELTSRAPESCTTVNMLRFLSLLLWLNKQSSKSYLYYTEESRKKSVLSYNLFLNTRQ